MKDDKQKNLDQMEAKEMVTKVNNPTDWISNAVLARKNFGDLRCCIRSKKSEQSNQEKPLHDVHSWAKPTHCQVLFTVWREGWLSPSSAHLRIGWTHNILNTVWTVQVIASTAWSVFQLGGIPAKADRGIGGTKRSRGRSRWHPDLRSNLGTTQQECQRILPVSYKSYRKVFSNSTNPNATSIRPSCRTSDIYWQGTESSQIQPQLPPSDKSPNQRIWKTHAETHFESISRIWAHPPSAGIESSMVDDPAEFIHQSMFSSQRSRKPYRQISNHSDRC